eukprot:6410867-Amphidinium_carterae.1
MREKARQCAKETQSLNTIFKRQGTKYAALSGQTPSCPTKSVVNLSSNHRIELDKYEKCPSKAIMDSQLHEIGVSSYYEARVGISKERHP